MVKIDMELVERISSSDCCGMLGGQPRYDLFRAPGVSPEQYIQWLDVDFDNKQHLFKTAMLAQAIAELDGSDPISAERAIQTALIHDGQEAIKSDINYNFKTAASDLEEADLLVRIVEEGLLDVPVEMARVASEIMKSKVVATAWQTVLNPPCDMPELQLEYLTCLAANVVANQYEGLLHYADIKNRKSASYVLRELHATLGEIFEYSCNDFVVEQHRQFYQQNGFSNGKIETLEQKLYAGFVAWQQQPGEDQSCTTLQDSSTL